MEHERMADFPASLKSLRLAKQIGQKELSAALNISLKTVSHWETGYSEPSLSQLVALADFFDVTLDDLVGRTL